MFPCLIWSSVVIALCLSQVQLGIASDRIICEKGHFDFFGLRNFLFNLLLMPSSYQGEGLLSHIPAMKGNTDI